MTSIAELLAAGTTRSIEFFPPRSEDAERQLHVALDELAALRPSFASVTYGALGTTRERTRDLVVGMNADHPFPTMAHLTCVGHTRAEIAALLDDYARRGVDNILALGGDPPADGSDPGGDFTHASELVELVRDHPGGFTVGVAAHPELHPRSTDRDSDRRNLAAKLRAADFAITQFFFRSDDYARMLDELGRLGCDRPVVPGIMPVVSVPGLRRMAAMNGTRIPRDLEGALDRAGDDARAVADVGVEVATRLCEDLLRAGAPGLHLYTLNRAASVRRIWENLGSEVARAV
jgi:methylenetetrahydrofolate reductase (NADPH)